MHSVSVLGKHAVLNTAAQSALICWLTLNHSSLPEKKLAALCWGAALHHVCTGNFPVRSQSHPKILLHSARPITDVGYLVSNTVLRMTEWQLNP